MPATQVKERNNQVVSFNFQQRNQSSSSAPSIEQTNTSSNHKTITLPISVLQGNAAPAAEPVKKPHLVPVDSAKSTRKSSRRLPFLAKTNKTLQTVLVAMCGFAICAYGLDVVVSHDVGKLQSQARRLSEQNSELSAQLLKSISYGELKDSVVGRFGLRVPDHVLIVKEISAPEVPTFKSHRHQLPLMSGY